MWFAQLRATLYRRMLGAPQASAPQDQGGDPRTVLARSSEKPTPKPQSEGCSSSGNLRGPKGGRGRKPSPACDGHYHFIAELQVQKFILPTGAHNEGKENSHGGFGKHRLQCRGRMLVSRNPRRQGSLIGVNRNHV